MLHVRRCTLEPDAAYMTTLPPQPDPFGSNGCDRRSLRSAKDLRRAAEHERCVDILRLDTHERGVPEIGLDIVPAFEPERRGALVRAEAEEARRRDDVALPRAATGDRLQLAQLLERIDSHVRVRADAHADSALAQRLHRYEAVAEVRLRGRADTDARTRVRQQVELVPVGVGRVDDRRVRPEAARLREQLDRPHAVLGYALLDLPRLLVGVDVQRQRLGRGVPPELLEPLPRTGAHGVGSDADAHARFSHRLQLREVLRHRALAETL